MTAKRLKEIRASLGLSQAGLARELGCAVESIENWEQGRKPVPAYMEKLIELYAEKTLTAKK